MTQIDIEYQLDQWEMTRKTKPTLRERVKRLAEGRLQADEVDAFILFVKDNLGSSRDKVLDKSEVNRWIDQYLIFLNRL